jgi:hypothetical protein
MTRVTCPGLADAIFPGERTLGFGQADCVRRPAGPTQLGGRERDNGTAKEDGIV